MTQHTTDLEPVSRFIDRLAQGSAAVASVVILLIAAGCDASNDTDSGAADGETQEFGLYVEYVEQNCRVGDYRVLFAQAQGGINPGDIRLFSEPGNGFIYIDSECRLFVPRQCPDAHCLLEGFRPHATAQLTTVEAASILYQARALDWSDAFEPESFYGLGIDHDPGWMIRFEDATYNVSNGYSDTEPWGEDQPDEAKWGEQGFDVLNPLNYQLHRAVSNYGPLGLNLPIDNLSDRLQEHESERMWMAVTPIPAGLVDGSQVSEWPLDAPPSAFTIVPQNELYCFGTANKITTDADKKALRDFLIEAAPKSTPQNQFTVFVKFEDAEYAIQFREGLPFEDERGLIPNIWETWGPIDQLCGAI